MEKWLSFCCATRDMFIFIKCIRTCVKCLSVFKHSAAKESDSKTCIECVEEINTLNDQLGLILVVRHQPIAESMHGWLKTKRYNQFIDWRKESIFHIMTQYHVIFFPNVILKLKLYIYSIIFFYRISANSECVHNARNRWNIDNYC